MAGTGESGVEGGEGPVVLEAVEADGTPARHRVLLGLAMLVVAVAAVAIGAALLDENSDAQASLETITDLDGLRSAIPEVTEASEPFRMTMEMGLESGSEGLSLPLGMSMDLRSDGRDSSMDLTMFGRTISMVSSGEVVYLPRADGAGWVAYRVADPDAASLSIFGGADPLTILDDMSATHPVELVGTETVDGVELTHYLVRNDFAAVLEDSASSDGQREAIANLGFGALPSMTIDAWIDPDGLLRRMDMTVEADETTITMAIRVEVLDEDPQISIPTDAEGPFDVDHTNPTGRFTTHLTGLLTG